METSKAASRSTFASKNLPEWMRQHPLFSFFFVAFAFSWIVFIPYALAEWGFLRGNFTFFYIIHTFGPAPAAVAVTAVIARRAGLQNLRQCIRQRQASWQLYLFVLLGIPASKGGGQGTGFTTFLTNFPIFTLAVVSLAVILTWIFNHTRGSIFIAILAHAGVDAPEAAGLLALFPAVSMIGMHWALLIGFGVPALLILILTRGQLGYQPGQEQPLNSAEGIK